MERPFSFLVRAVLQVFVVAAVWFALLAPLLHSVFSVGIEPVGHVNGLIVVALLLWLFEDVISTRPRIYARYGLREPVMRHSVRFLRTICLLALTIVAWADLLRAELLNGNENDWRFWVSIGVLISTSVAALGWMLTSHRSQQEETLAQTEAALRDYLQDSQYITLRRILGLLHKAALRAGATSKGAVRMDFLEKPIAEILKGELKALSTDADLVSQLQYQRPAIIWVYETLNFFGRIAHGVRRGRLDFDYTYDAMFDLFEGIYTKWRFVLEAELPGLPGTGKADGKRGDHRSFDGVYVYEHLWWLIYNTRKRIYAPHPARRSAALRGLVVDSNHVCFSPWLVRGWRRGRFMLKSAGQDRS